MSNMKFSIAVNLLACLLPIIPVQAGQAKDSGLELHNLFQAHMVLQRDKPIAVWGWADRGSRVKVSFGESTATATAGEDRSWKVVLPAMPANATPQSMVVTSGKLQTRLENVLVGDVWVIGGQSNMQHPLSNVEGGQLEIISAHFPKVRLLTVPPLIDDKRKSNFELQVEGESERGDWNVCSPKTVPPFSAIGYVFGRRLHMVSEIPMGLIDVSRWGTTVESWVPREVLVGMDNAAVKEQLKQWEDQIAKFDPEKDLQARIARYKKHRPDGTNPPTGVDPGPQANQNFPGNCYNSFIAPISGFAIKGAIFHQGFNNSRADAAELYHPVFCEMINFWRKAFNDPDMPFGIISLCTDGDPQTLENFCEGMMNHGVHVREAQYKTFLKFHRAGDRNIGFASSFDQRHAWYHPQNKIPAGERIARWALSSQYGFERNIHWQPPMVTKMEAKGRELHLHFDKEVTTEERGQAIEGFAISGSDKRYQPATANPLVTRKDGRGRPQHDKRVLVLSSPHVANPVHFRYAWARNPMGNLRAAGNPQRHIAFAAQRSDDWAYWEVPHVALAEGERDSRQAIEKIRAALRFIDLERRVKDAELLLERDKALYLEQKRVQALK